MITKTLLAPDIITGGGTVPADPSSDPSALQGWMSMTAENQPEVDGVTAPNPPPKKEETNGKPDDKSTGTGSPGVADVKPGESPKPAAAAKDKPVSDAKVDPKVDDKKDSKKEEDKWPRSSGDWDKYKKVHAEKEAKLQAEIDARETRLKELETKLQTVEKAAPKSVDPSPELVKKLEAYEKRNEEMSKRLQVLDVTQHPDFQAYFSNKIGAQKVLAKRILGDDKADEFDKIVALPDGQYKNDQLDAFVGDLPMLSQSRIGAVLNNLEAINQERTTEIARASELKAKLTEEEKSKATHTQAQTVALRDKLIEETTASLQDPKTGMAIFQHREGDETWNSAVNERLATAKRLLTGQGNIKPADIVKAAFHATAFPDLLQAYGADMKARDEQIAKLEEQVKSLSAAQPGGGSQAESAAGEVKPRSEVRIGQNPMEAAAAWTKGLGAFD